jgi:hypothetical protein
LTHRKKAPSSPEIVPIINAPIKSPGGVTTSGLLLANLRALSEKLIGSPCTRLSQAAATKTATPHVKKVFHSTSNFHMGLNLESSYKNRAPPIGAPKAMLTPAEAPATISYLFL